MPAPMPREAPVTRATLLARVGKGRGVVEEWPFVVGGLVVVEWPFVVGAPLSMVSAGVGTMGGGAEVVSVSGVPFERDGASVVAGVVVVEVVGSEGRGWGVGGWSLEMASIFFYFRESGWLVMEMGKNDTEPWRACRNVWMAG